MTFHIEQPHEDLTLIRVDTMFSRSLSFCAWASLIDGVLIDSGFPHASGQMLSALKGRRVEQIVVTHEHEDHIGGCGPVARAFGSKVYCPAPLVPVLRNPRSISRLPYRHLLWGIPEKCEADPLGPSVVSGRSRLEVIPTPGHTRDHVCFFLPQRRWLFTGDLFLGTKVLQARLVENTADLLASLYAAKALRPTLLICSHRGPIPDPTDLLDAKIRFLEEFRDSAARLTDQGLTPQAIARRLLGREDPIMTSFTFGDYTRLRLVRTSLLPRGSYLVPIG